jgi:NitT/TauT family transport system substrate-binding protein
MKLRLKNVLTSLSLALVASVVVAGCSGNNPTAESTNKVEAPSTEQAAPKLEKITIGYTPTIVLPQPLVGTEDGEYEKKLPGVKVEKKLFGAGSAILEAVRAGTVDIGFSGPLPAIKAYAKSGDIILLANAANGGTELSVLASSPIKSVKDLKGKVVGVNQPGSTVDAFVRHNLIKAGLKPDTDVRIIEIAPGEQAAALQSGQVAAVAAPAPWPSQATVNAKARPLLDWKQIVADGEYSAGSVWATKKFVEANPEFVKEFLAAHSQITDELNADRAKGDARVLAAWSKVSKKTLKPEVAEKAFKTIVYNAKPSQKDMQFQADLGFETGGLKKKADLTGFIYEAK